MSRTRDSYTATQDMYLDAAGKLVPGDSPMAATLLARKGQEIPRSVAEVFGLGKTKKVAAKENTRRVDKLRKQPVEDKSRHGGAIGSKDDDV